MLFIIIAFKRKLSVSSHAPSVEGKTEKSWHLVQPGWREGRLEVGN